MGLQKTREDTDSAGLAGLRNKLAITPLRNDSD
jgi:hypothetical protein